MAHSALSLFPLGVAVGDAHCNRDTERAALKRQILDGTHTWLWARRRMGKTSLIEQVIADLHKSRRKVLHLAIDLLVVHDGAELELRIRQGVERLAIALLPGNQKATDRLAKTFRRLRPEFTIGAGPLKMKLNPADTGVACIAEQLQTLDEAAGQHNRRVVIVLDEFQQLTQFRDAQLRNAAEGAIRHAVERAQHITYVFAGSQRHLLASMFEDQDRPLFHLCRKMSLDRIAAEHYQAFLQKAANARWKRELEASRIEQILTLTTRHPFYMNALCRSLWAAARPPSQKAIQGAWDQLVEEERSVVTGRLLRLSGAQRALLKAIADQPGGVPHPTAMAFLSPLRLPSSTGTQAKEVLEEQDLIHQAENEHWYLVDPVMAECLRAL